MLDRILMMLELSQDDVRLLQTVLTRHLEEQRVELLHTEDRKLHREFAAEVDRLEQLAEQVRKVLETSPARA